MPSAALLTSLSRFVPLKIGKIGTIDLVDVEHPTEIDAFAVRILAIRPRHKKGPGDAGAFSQANFQRRGMRGGSQ
jgi:hypothetical protein